MIDLAQTREQADREAAIARVRLQLPEAADAAEDCAACGDEIEPERRRALPGVKTCLFCQEARERRGRGV